MILVESELQRVDGEVNGVTSTLTSPQEETLWIEGLVPGIDFCNHGKMLNRFFSIIIESSPLYFQPHKSEEFLFVIFITFL